MKPNSLETFYTPFGWFFPSRISATFCKLCHIKCYRFGRARGGGWQWSSCFALISAPARDILNHLYWWAVTKVVITSTSTSPSLIAPPLFLICLTMFSLKWLTCAIGFLFLKMKNQPIQNSSQGPLTHTGEWTNRRKQGRRQSVYPPPTPLASFTSFGLRPLRLVSC